MCGLPRSLHLHFLLFFVQEYIFSPLLLSCAVFLSAAPSHGDEDIQVETVVRLPEEQDENEAEETGAGETPVEPRQLWIRNRRMFGVRFYASVCDDYTEEAGQIWSPVQSHFNSSQNF